MSAFELPEEPRLLNSGAVKFDIRQMLPRTSAISGTRPGVSGATQGITTFDWTDEQLHWIPALSYFTLRGHFLDGSGNALARPPTGTIAVVDNWCAVLFQQIQLFMNSTSVELLNNPAQADTALLYSSVDRTWLKSFGSSSGVGDGLQTRMLNAAQFGTAQFGTASNYNELVATWRPSLSIFDCASAIPPGAQMRIDFSYSNTAEQNMIESAASKIAGTDYTFILDEFTFYKASVMPDPETPLPTRGLIELNPVQVNSFALSGGNTLQQTVPLPATCNRILVGIQDNNTANNLAAGQNGLKPITSFAAAVSNGASDFASYISQLYINFPDLGVQAPNPTYSFTAGSSAGSKSGWERAYQDFITVCRGDSGGYEGSVPMGSYDSAIGTQINTPLQTVTPVVQAGDPNNDQQFAYWSTGTGAVAATAYSQFARWGWLGRCPGPIFAFPCVRPKDRTVSNATINLVLSGNATSCNVFIISSYSMGIAVEKDPSTGRYSHMVLRGL